MTLLSSAKHAFYLDLIDFTVRTISALVVFLAQSLLHKARAADCTHFSYYVGGVGRLGRWEDNQMCIP